MNCQNNSISADELWGTKLFDSVFKTNYSTVPNYYINMFDEELTSDDTILIFQRTPVVTKTNIQCFYCKYSTGADYEKIIQCIKSRLNIPTIQTNLDNQL